MLNWFIRDDATSGIKSKAPRSHNGPMPIAPESTVDHIRSLAHNIRWTICVNDVAVQGPA